MTKTFENADSQLFSGDGTSGTTKGTSLNIVDANDKADLNFAGNDFTFEAWIFPAAGVQWNALYSQSWGLQIYIDTTSGDNLVKVWDPYRRSLIQTFEGHIGDVTALAVSSDGKLAFSGSQDGIINVWSLSFGGVYKNFLGHSE